MFFFLDSDIFIGEILAKCPILSLSVYSRVGKLFIHLMIGGLHLQGGEEVEETLPVGEITSGAVAIEGSPEVGFVI